jgi:nucleotide-binding universal stress UspA family protein
MLSNVLVGVDGRQGGRDAIALARELAAPGAAITLVHVYGSDWVLGRGAGLAVAMAREDAGRLLVTARHEADIDAGLLCSPLTPPARGLHEVAEQRGADLLVVGSSRHALLGRALIGDDTRAALNGAPCAIAIAPRGYTQTDHRFRKLGVGYDGTREAEAALALARELADRHDAAIRAMWVVSLQNVKDASPLPADWPQAIEVLVSHCQGELERLGGVEADATYGGPREELSRLGGEVDLLIVGSRAYGPVHRLFHGTTSTYLMRHTGCPLLVLPRVAEAAEADETVRASQTAADPREPTVQARGDGCLGAQR